MQNELIGHLLEALDRAEQNAVDQLTTIAKFRPAWLLE
jgi:hypothetical protein